MEKNKETMKNETKFEVTIYNKRCRNDEELTKVLGLTEEQKDWLRDKAPRSGHLQINGISYSGLYRLYSEEEKKEYREYRKTCSQGSTNSKSKTIIRKKMIQLYCSIPEDAKKLCLECMNETEKTAAKLIDTMGNNKTAVEMYLNTITE